MTQNRPDQRLTLRLPSHRPEQVVTGTRATVKIIIIETAANCSGNERAAAPCSGPPCSFVEPGVIMSSCFKVRSRGTFRDENPSHLEDPCPCNLHSAPACSTHELFQRGDRLRHPLLLILLPGRRGLGPAIPGISHMLIFCFS